jgi:hypothetical protein
MIGTHEFTFEEPDVVVMDPSGTVTREHACIGGDAIARFAAGKPRVFILCRLGKGGSMPAESRRAFALRMANVPVSGVVSFGATPVERALMSMMGSVINLVGKLHFPLHFSASEREARAWIDERRAALTRG